MLQTISSWFRRINVLIQRTEPKRLASGRHRWLQFSNNMGRSSSRAQVIWISTIRFFKFSLLFHLSFLVDVFNKKSLISYGTRLKFTWESNRLQMTKKLKLYVRLTIWNITGKVDRDEYELYWLTSCRSSSFGHCCLQITFSIKGGLLLVYLWCQGFLFLDTSSCRVAFNKVLYMQCLSRGIPWISHSQLDFLRYTLQPLY